MTTAAAAAVANSPLADLEYRFSLERLAELNRDPAPLLLSRLTPDCPSYGTRPTAVNDPARLVQEIHDRCGNDDTYIRSALPLQEIVFRTLLLNGGEPVSLEQLHRDLTEQWSTQVRPITITMAGLARIMDNDVFYGFEMIPLPEPEPAEEESELPALDLADFGMPFAPDAAILAYAAAEDDEDDDIYDDDEDDDFDEDDE